MATIALSLFALAGAWAQSQALDREPHETEGAPAETVEPGRSTEPRAEGEPLPDTTFRPSERIPAGQPVAFPANI